MSSTTSPDRLRDILDAPPRTVAAPTPSPLPPTQLYGGMEGTQRGLFGREGLHHPQDFDRLAQEAQRQARDEQAFLVHSPSAPMTLARAQALIRSLDRMSELICGIADPAQLACQLVPHRAWHTAAMQAHLTLQHFISQLNSDPRLLRAAEAVMASAATWEALTGEQRAVIHSLVVQFRAQGLHQEEAGRQAVIEAQGQINELIAHTEAQMFGSGGRGPTLQALQDVVHRRRDLARLQGAPSYGHLAMLERAQFQEPAHAVQFLHTLDDHLERLPVEAHLPRSSRAHDDESSGPSIDDYLSVGKCMEGLGLLMQGLFGIDMRVTSFLPGESWHPSVHRLELTEEDGTLAGIVYLDLFEREGKFDGAATFCINFSTQENGGQVPHVCVALSLEEEAREAMGWAEARCLFHEWGHVINVILSRTRYQHLAGVRSALDYVEMPSTLMEAFGADYRFLSRFASHATSRAPLPEGLFSRLVEQHGRQALLHTKREILLSLFDLTVHGELCEKDMSWEALQAHLLAQVAPHPRTNPLHALVHRRGLDISQFLHLIYYGSGYYSYLLCRVYSAHLFRSQFEDQLLDRRTGQRYRELVLARGGTENPLQMMSAFLQGQPPLHYQPFLDMISRHSLFAC